ncbi:hypothetical protein BS297_25660 [Rhodococcus erythropolis]|uniref:Uncharacterized protein n=1 Tax=Rhodococcus erythropolis TaxID=1833 RepID=A0A0C2WJ95_RHOER|nr:hypothetical protein BS297_25660 [Rhodococcus erythropolis]KIM17852.1 hypothetical protein QV65_01610 [Rhodococcus erythropolis]
MGIGKLATNSRGGNCSTWEAPANARLKAPIELASPVVEPLLWNSATLGEFLKVEVGVRMEQHLRSDPHDIEPDAIDLT